MPSSIIQTRYSSDNSLSVLVCYSGKDRGYVNAEIHKLKDIGLSVVDYLGKDISCGDWRDWVADQFMLCNFIIVFLSRNIDPNDSGNTAATALELITSSAMDREKLFLIEIDQYYQSAKPIVNAIKQLLPNRWFSYEKRQKYLSQLSLLIKGDRKAYTEFNEYDRYINSYVFPHFLIDDKSFTSTTEDENAVISLIIVDLTIPIKFSLPFSLPIEIQAKNSNFLTEWLYFSATYDWCTSDIKYLTIYSNDADEFFSSRRRLVGFDEIREFYTDKDITTYMNFFFPEQKSSSTTDDIIQSINNREMKKDLRLSSDVDSFLDYCLNVRRNEWITYRFLEQKSHIVRRQSTLSAANSFLQYIYILSHLSDSKVPSFVISGIYNNHDRLVEYWLKKHGHPIYTGSRLKLLFNYYFGKIPTNSRYAIDLWRRMVNNHQHLLARIKYLSSEYIKSLCLIAELTELPNVRGISDMPTYLMSVQLAQHTEVNGCFSVKNLTKKLEFISMLISRNYDHYNSSRAIIIDKPCII